MKNLITRKEYMAGECTHREYFAQFTTPGTIALVKRGIGVKRILASHDPHFNDIPLREWDALVPRAPGSGRFAAAGEQYTLAAGVCLLKEAAQQIKDRGEA